MSWGSGRLGRSRAAAFFVVAILVVDSAVAFSWHSSRAPVHLSSRATPAVTLPSVADATTTSAAVTTATPPARSSTVSTPPLPPLTVAPPTLPPVTVPPLPPIADRCPALLPTQRAGASGQPHAQLFSSGLPANAAPEQIVAGPDGALWFTDSSGRIGRVDLTGKIQEYTPPGGPSTPAHLTIGADCNIWFTENRGNRIGRLTVSGTFTMFPVAIGPVSFISPGPNGTIWFDISGVNTSGLARLNPDGTATDFSSKIGPNAQLAGMALGPDGDLWFVEQAQGRIGRVDANGTVREFSAGIPKGTHPFMISAGSDGALWFTEEPSAFGRITTGGVITQFAGPSVSGPIAGPTDITAGPDGAMWFTEGGVPGDYDHIGRLATNGQIQTYSDGIPSGYAVGSLAVGADSNMWFTIVPGRYPGALGRLDLFPTN